MAYLDTLPILRPLAVWAQGVFQFLFASLCLSVWLAWGCPPGRGGVRQTVGDEGWGCFFRGRTPRLPRLPGFLSALFSPPFLVHFLIPVLGPECDKMEPKRSPNPPKMIPKSKKRRFKGTVSTKHTKNAKRKLQLTYIQKVTHAIRPRRRSRNTVFYSAKLTEKLQKNTGCVPWTASE